MDDDGVLRNVGPRLRQLRLEREATLTDLAGETGISVSTLSRLESGQRKPTLELLLPLARAHRVALDYRLPIANAILTTEDLAPAVARQTDKGRDAARVAVEMAQLLAIIS